MEDKQQEDLGKFTYTPKYLRVSAVKALIKRLGKRAGADFIEAVDRMVERKVRAACNTHNGSKKTLDISVASYVGINKNDTPAPPAKPKLVKRGII